MFPEDGQDVETHFKNVSTALQHALNTGKKGYQFYSRAMNESALEMLRLENDLHRAIERDELLLYYQPKMDLATNSIVGMESLIRWQRPVVGLVPPMKFIPLAEASGLIIPIGRFVLRAACMQLEIWRAAGLPSLCCAINVSTRQLEHQDFVADVRSIVEQAGLDPRCFEIEITESAIMRDPEKAIRILNELKDHGFKISIDDFGTGYSSLSYLKRLPLSSLKIDISFVRNILTNSNDEVIVRTIVAMAHSLNLTTIAEGVETEQQCALLKQLGCDEIQGYLLSPPVPAEKYPSLLADLRHRGWN
jgi:EAL domain-containing protein (putative c-di-GMP-specific phosphodiesterase class I)